MQRVTLEKWDTDIKPHLADIEFDAGWIKHYANNLARRCGALYARPEWETNAEAVLREAIETVTSSLELLIAAERSYKSKPVVD